MVADWVVARRPHLVFIELAINDGDTLLETEDGDSIGSALEGIVRHVRDALPRCELCLFHMFIRDDLPLRLLAETPLGWVVMIARDISYDPVPDPRVVEVKLDSDLR